MIYGSHDDRLNSTDNPLEMPMIPRHKLLLAALLIALHAVSGAVEPDAGTLLKAAFGHFRGLVSGGGDGPHLKRG
jgi:hypothetical protein